MESVILGLNLSHDSSCSVHRNDGKLLAAVEEERFSRRKNEASFPRLSIRNLVQNLHGIGEFKVKEIVIGSHKNPSELNFNTWHQLFNPPNHPGWPNQPYVIAPGDHKEIENIKLNFPTSASYIEYEINKELNQLGHESPNMIKWIAHHDSHSASGAIGAPWRNSVTDTLAFSFDGSGDNESGVIQKFSNKGFVKDLARIPFTQSLGNVYSEVTARYGFKKNRHEGKITGLAALGSFSPAVEYLLNCVVVKNGVPVINLSKNQFTWIINRILVKSNLTNFKKPKSIERMIDVATSVAPNYPDLAFAIQEVIEDRIVDVVKFWINETGTRDITLSGGVFSNVKLNQKIGELADVKKLFIFPNMGDGGLSAGGVWRYLFENKRLGQGVMFDNMYLGPASSKFSLTTPDSVNVMTFEKGEDLYSEIANLLAAGYIGGSCIGQMEFGPRALCNRSILAAPFNSEINKSLNLRLKRTEFMPFAPVVLAEYAEEIFDLSKYDSLVPFEYMTMTCDVKDQWRQKIPAVVHVDGTARPQLINAETNFAAYRILQNFYHITKTPVLINTSFNAHEEPIIENLNQAISALIDHKVDFVFDETRIFFVNHLPISK